ncbi:hypothetical protein WDW89_13430 [Deltaproteobacteria bacterium TL4]
MKKLLCSLCGIGLSLVGSFVSAQQTPPSLMLLCEGPLIAVKMMQPLTCFLGGKVLKSTLDAVTQNNWRVVSMDIIEADVPKAYLLLQKQESPMKAVEEQLSQVQEKLKVLDTLNEILKEHTVLLKKIEVNTD